MVYFHFVVFLYMRVGRTYETTQLALYFTIINSHPIAVSIVLNQFSHSVTLFHPRDYAYLFVDVGD